MVCVEIGMALFIFGACCMDSADLKIPVGICLFGLAIVGIGMLIGGRYDT